MAEESGKPQPNYNPFPPGQSSRSMIVEIDAEDMGHMLRRGFTSSHGKFTIYCDETGDDRREWDGARTSALLCGFHIVLRDDPD